MISKIMAHQHLVLVNHRCMDIIKFHQTRLTIVFLHPPVHPFGLEGSWAMRSRALSRLPPMAWKMFFELPEKGLHCGSAGS